MIISFLDLSSLLWSFSDFCLGGWCFLYGFVFPPLEQQGRRQGKVDFGGLGGHQCYKGDMGIGFQRLISLQESQSIIEFNLMFVSLLVRTPLDL
jgi:hypothetical protein